MINEWGNPNTKFVILGVDPTAPNSDRTGDMKYPFNLPDYEDIENGKKSIRTRYFHPIYDNVLSVLQFDKNVNETDIAEFIRSHFLIVNAIGFQIKDGNGKLLETSSSMHTKGNKDNIWLETFLKESDGQTPQSLLRDRIRNKTVFLTSSYLFNIFRDEEWYQSYRDIDNKLKETYVTGKPPNVLLKSENSYEADFYPFYRHRKYRLSDKMWELYKLRIRNILNGHEGD